MALAKDPKQVLNELYVRHGGSLEYGRAPEYTTKKSGPDHMPAFKCTLRCPSIGMFGFEPIVVEAQRLKKKDAETAAAAEAVQRLRGEEGLDWPPGTFHASPARQRGTEATAGLVGRTFTLTEELAGTLGDDSLAILERQLLGGARDVQGRAPAGAPVA